MSVDLIDRPAKMGLRERQRQARGEAILSAAFALMAEKGYDALTMEELAETVGISRQTLYHHFSCKEDIALQAVLTLMEQGIQSIQTIAIDSNLAPIERLEQVMRWMMEIRFRPGPAAIVKARVTLMRVKTHPDYLIAFERRAAAICQIVEDAQAAGEVQSHLPSRVIVQMLLGLISDAHYESLIAEGKATQSDIIETIISVFFRGIRA